MNLKHMLFIPLFVAGCSHLDHIPIPTDRWSYTVAEDENAEYKLNVEVEFIKPKISKEHVFLFKTVDIQPGAVFGFHHVIESCLFDGNDGSSAIANSTYRISDITEDGVLIEISTSLENDDNDSGFSVEDEIMIPFENSGEINKKNIHYKWTWKQLTPNQRVDLTR